MAASPRAVVPPAALLLFAAGMVRERLAALGIVVIATSPHLAGGPTRARLPLRIKRQPFFFSITRLSQESDIS